MVVHIGELALKISQSFTGSEFASLRRRLSRLASDVEESTKT